MYWKYSVFLMPIFFNSCAVTPNRGHLTMDKVIKLDERAIEDVRVGIKLEWLR